MKSRWSTDCVRRRSSTRRSKPACIRACSGKTSRFPEMETADAADDHTVMVDPPPLGRVFSLMRRGLLGDCAPCGTRAARRDRPLAAGRRILRRGGRRYRAGRLLGAAPAPESGSADSRASASAARSAPSAARSAACGRNAAPRSRPPRTASRWPRPLRCGFTSTLSASCRRPITLAELEIYGESAAGSESARAAAPPAPGSGAVRVRVELPRTPTVTWPTTSTTRSTGRRSKRCCSRTAPTGRIWPRSTPRSSSAPRPSRASSTSSSTAATAGSPTPSEGGEIYASIDLMNARTTPGSN